MELRPYQREAVDAVYRYLRERDGNPVIVLPTAAGKTPLLATICDDAITKWNGRVLVLAHVRELLEQTRGHLAEMASHLRVGIYSAGLRRRDTDHAVIVAGIQSAYRRACDLGPFHLVLIDEAHMIPPEGDGMYRQFLADAKVINPNIRVIGLTATPFRMTSGPICTPDGYLNAICYEIGVKELIRDGYLCPLRTKAGHDKADFENLHVRGGEFIPVEVEAAMDTDALVRSACAEIVEYTKDRHSVLIFASGVQHGRHIQQILQDVHGVECGFVCGATPDTERDELLARFRGNGQAALFGGKGPLKCLCNVNVLTTGFDAPNIDCVALLRPTNSPGLYYQCCGRGFRLHPSKKDCLILDYGGNVLRHGPVDAIRVQEQDKRGEGEAPAKECPNCHELVVAGYQTCPECGYEFPPPERQRHEPKASTESVLSGEVTVLDYEVQAVTYAVHVKKDAPPDHPRTMRVDYQVGFQLWFSEWVCIEHTGWPRQRAESWWRERCHEACPATADAAVEIARSGALAPTLSIKVRQVSGEKFPRIIGYTLGPKSPRPSAGSGRHELVECREPGADEDIEQEAEPAAAWYDDLDVPF